MWGGVVFGVLAAVLTGPVLGVAAVHWPAAIAWTVVGVVLAAVTTYVSQHAVRNEGSVATGLRVSRRLLAPEIVYVTGLSVATGALSAAGAVLLFPAPRFTGRALSRVQSL